MLNIYDAVRTNPGYRKLEIDGFLFAEYTCGLSDRKLPVWTEIDYLVHVVTGKKTWHTPEGIRVANPGDTIFFKKGAAVVEQHFEEDVCLLMVFIPDALLRTALREVLPALDLKAGQDVPTRVAIRVKTDTAFTAFFQSLRVYLSSREKPPDLLVRLKLKELAIGVLASGANEELGAYFRRLGAGDVPFVQEIMEANFRYNLSLEEYARLCHRSLSSFKREFQARYQESPGKWLLQRRLDHAARLLAGPTMNVTEIAFESGFEDVSHFSRVFKQRFNVPPVNYRQRSAAKARTSQSKD